MGVWRVGVCVWGWSRDCAISTIITSWCQYNELFTDVRGHGASSSVCVCVCVCVCV